MTTQGWITLTILLVMLGGLFRYSHLVDVIFLGGLTILGLTGVLTANEVLSGFSNFSVIIVGALFVVAAGLTESGALGDLSRRVMIPPSDKKNRPLRRLVTISACTSAFLSNTTVVAIGLPLVLDWCRKHRQSPSQYLIPFNYAVISGGVCTLIGTSSTLVVYGLMLSHGMQGLSFLEIGKIGLPLTVLTILYLLYATPRWLPSRPELMDQIGATRREYTVEMVVESDCPLIGQTVQEAGLRQLPGLFLVEIDRAGGLISPVGPRVRIQNGDRLVFVGVVSTIIDLQQIRGLVPATEGQAPFAASAAHNRNLCEAVVSASSPLIGRGVREANFRTVYEAAIVAVHRNGQRLRGKIGDIVLQPGDTLLLLTGSGFIRANRNNPDFYLVSEIGGVTPVRHEKGRLAFFILAALVLAMTAPNILHWLGTSPKLAARLNSSRVLFALTAAGMMVALRCVSASRARRSIQWDVLLVIAASFGVALAIEKSGAAAFIADGLLALTPHFGPRAALASVYLIGLILTEFLTNNAAAALTFPIAMATAAKLGLDPQPFAIAVAISSTGGFMIPFGYQTHLMVYGPGGYRLSDFVRVGLPLDLIWFIASVVLIPIFWPF